MSTPDNVRVTEAVCPVCGGLYENAAGFELLPNHYPNFRQPAAPSGKELCAGSRTPIAAPDSTPSSAVPEPTEQGILLGVNPEFSASLRETALSCPPETPWSLVVELNNLREVRKAAAAYMETQHVKDFWLLQESLKGGSDIRERESDTARKLSGASVSDDAWNKVYALERAQSDDTEAWCAGKSTATLVRAKIDARNALLAHIAKLEAKAAAIPESPAVLETGAADCIPTTWLDPLLTGPNAVIGRYPYSGDDIERLLAAIRKRTEAVPRKDTVEVSRTEIEEAIERIDDLDALSARNILRGWLSGKGDSK